MKRFLIIGFSSLPKGRSLRFQSLLWLIPSLLCQWGKLNSQFPGAVISRLAQDSWCLNTLILSLHSFQTSMAAAVATSPRQQPPVSCFAHKPREGKSRSLDLQKRASHSALDDKTPHRPLALKTVTIEWSKGPGTRACSRKTERKREKKTLSPTRRMNINTCKDRSRGKMDGPYEHSQFFSRSVREGKGRFPLLLVWLSLLTFFNEWKIR